MPGCHDIPIANSDARCLIKNWFEEVVINSIKIFRIFSRIMCNALISLKCLSNLHYLASDVDISNVFSIRIFLFNTNALN